MGPNPHEVVFKDDEPYVTGMIKSSESSGLDGNGSVVVEICEVFIAGGLLRYTAACTHRFATNYINMVDIDDRYTEVIRVHEGKPVYDPRKDNQKDFFNDDECL